MFSRSPLPSTHWDIVNGYYRQYDEGIKHGQFLPFVYPWVALPSLFVMIYLLVPHRHSPFIRSLRWPLWVVLVVSNAYSIAFCKARNMATGFAVGLLNSWAVAWCTTIMMIYDPQRDFKRIERMEGGAARVFGGGRPYPVAYDSTETTASASSEDDQYANGTLSAKPKVTKAEDLGVSQGPRSRKGKLAWQPYPISPFIERLDWVADLFCNFRGMGWNWQITGPAPVPLFVQRELRETSGSSIAERDTKFGRSGTRRCDTKEELLRVKIRTFLIGYATLDVLKVLMINDPYFWGVVDYPAPPHFPEFIRNSPFLVKGYRLIVSQCGVLTVLCTICALGGILFAGVCGPELLGVRGEPWIYPSTYGSYANVLDHGLAGWWGGWWHQAFRFAFDAPSKKLNAALGIELKSLRGRLIQLVFAFVQSGILHATGSHTQMGDSNPISGPFFFFCLQVVGIIVQIALADVLRSAGITERLPKVVRRIGNFVYVHVWFNYTAPILCDDFARGGLWLVEPIPISPLRALGFGAEGDSWWCWGSSWRDWIHWHSGEHWWQSGLAL